MKNLIKALKPLITLLIMGLLVWYFSDIVFYISIALVFSIVVRPLKLWLSQKQIKGFKPGNTTASIISLLSIILVFWAFFLFIVPLIISQASLISSINPTLISDYYRHEIEQLFMFLQNLEIISVEQNFTSLVEGQLKEVIDLASFSFVFGKLLSATSSIFMAVFIILFLSFFFIKEPELIKQFIHFLTPEEYEEKMDHILKDSRIMLSRYFIGVLIEISTMMVLISVALSVLGIHNAVLIGFLGGLMNVIPYLGPLIGTTIGLILGVIYVLSMSMFDQIIYTILAIMGSFAFANLVDNFFLQPVIYSKSVKAHPVEIFLVIIMAGKFAGIVGMIAAIPVFTVFKIVMKQFSEKNILKISEDA